MAEWYETRGLNKTQVDTMSAPVRKAFKSMHQEIKTLRAQQAISIGTGDIKTGAMADSQILVERFEAAQKAMATFAGSGYGLDDGSSSLSIAVNSAISLTDTFLHNAKAGEQAMRGLAQSMDSGQFEAFTKAIGDSTGALAANAASLDVLGLDLRNFGKNIDMMVYSFNQGQDQVQGFNQELFNFAKTVKQLPNVVSQNFQLVAKSLAYSFPKIQTEFIKIQEMAAKTGVSVNKLMGTFGQQSDTIGGASSFAAGLNTILGKNVFSATRVLMMSESERMNATRDALKDSQIYRDYTSGDDRLKKFALRAISGKIGMSLDETRRFLDGDSSGGKSVKDQMASEIDGEFKNNRKAFSKGLGDLTKSIKDNVEIINELTRTKYERDIAILQTDRKLALSPGRGRGNIARDGAVITGAIAGLGVGKVGTDTDIQETGETILASPISGPMQSRLINAFKETALTVLAEPNLKSRFDAYARGGENSVFFKDIKAGRGQEALKRLNEIQKLSATTTGRTEDPRVTASDLDTLTARAQTPMDRARLLGEFREKNANADTPMTMKNFLDTRKVNDDLQKKLEDAKKPKKANPTTGGASLDANDRFGRMAQVTINLGSNQIVSKAFAEIVTNEMVS